MNDTNVDAFLPQRRAPLCKFTRDQSFSMLETGRFKKNTHQKTKKHFRKAKSTFYSGCEPKTTQEVTTLTSFSISAWVFCPFHIILAHSKGTVIQFILTIKTIAQGPPPRLRRDHYAGTGQGRGCRPCRSTLADVEVKDGWKRLLLQDGGVQQRNSSSCLTFPVPFDHRKADFPLEMCHRGGGAPGGPRPRAHLHTDVAIISGCLRGSNRNDPSVLTRFQNVF